MKVSVFLKYPHHVLITFILQSQIINHNIYINSSSHDPQWVSYRYLDKRKSPINGLFKPFMKLCLLFKLNRSRWLARQIVKYSIDPTHLVYNSAHDCLEHCEWNLGTLGCHEIYSVYGTQCNCVIVGSLVAHNAD